MARVSVSYDNQPEDCLDAICKVLSSLDVHYEHIDDDTTIHIDYKTPQEEFEQGVPVEIELEEKELFTLMNMAHEQNITLNKLVNNLLRELIEKEEKK